MLTKVRVVRFKRFADFEFDLRDQTLLLAGPNNSGKTTLLQAISAWNLGLQMWLAERGTTGGKQRRVSVVLDEFTALPLREMNLLWLNRHTAKRIPPKKEPKPAPIYIQVFWESAKRAQQELTVEFMYANEKMVYVRPVKSPEDPTPVESLPDFAQKIQVVHVPAFSGIGTQEPRRSVGYQNKLVGEGKPGEIVRNLLLEIWEKSGKNIKSEPWRLLAEDIDRLFSCELLPPEFVEAKSTYIVSEYRPRTRFKDESRPPKLDIANAGSGFHQVLMLLAFFYARPTAILLLDEPDAHLHFILQREIYDLLRRVANERGVKLLIATHSEVLLSSTEPDRILSFIGQNPKRLVSPAEKQTLQSALKQLTALDLLQADHVGCVLYVEDESDHKILREWSEVLGHPATAFLKFPFLVPLRGVGNLDEKKRHFQCLRHVNPKIKALCLIDRDLGKEFRSAGMPEGMELHVWNRYEIENYLLNADVVKRFLGEASLFNSPVVDEEFGRSIPPGTDWLADVRVLRDLKASEFLVDVLARTSNPLEKGELYMLAAKMLPEEIHPEVKLVLDKLAALIPARIPCDEANLAPADPGGVEELDATDTP
jgi:predicted ATPase